MVDVGGGDTAAGDRLADRLVAIWVSGTSFNAPPKVPMAVRVEGRTKMSAVFMAYGFESGKGGFRLPLSSENG